MLGITLYQSLNWNDFISSKLQQYYSTLTCLSKTKRYTSYHTRKQLSYAQSYHTHKQLAKLLILSKFDNGNLLLHNTFQINNRRMEKVKMHIAPLLFKNTQQNWMSWRQNGFQLKNVTITASNASKFISGSVYMIFYCPKWKFISVKITAMK